MRRRVVLVHYDPAAGEGRSRALRRAGFDVLWVRRGGTPAIPIIAGAAPDAIVIDLTRRPSDGFGTALLLRQRVATRRVPLVFAGGVREKVARVRAFLPDAAFAQWTGIRAALRRAIANPPASPIVRGTMEPYAGAPLPKKLGVRPGSLVALMGAPRGFENTLGALPEGARITSRAPAGADLVVLFAASRADLERRLPAAEGMLAERGSVWIAWPKRASGATSDLSQPVVRAAGLGRGLVDYKIAALDERWSALRFARRARGGARPSRRGGTR